MYTVFVTIKSHLYETSLATAVAVVVVSSVPAAAVEDVLAPFLSRISHSIILINECQNGRDSTASGTISIVNKL